ncbi:3'-5' exonuclease [Fictibacillus barbaricus]|uniref:Inhibitor of KinA sporulation pathway (Predicted exonuclease) n=1 Tax=Fictibacillus barbaricus TaxID=182136 RepID=A0ABU1U424_9BACL|nr:3'-5' exonuclease [Fictibacillus barbaricus]MDR7074136.1 inhibitor of KinA sporulation pathway (predicted exonuclease) [Fictibacillus barbaricus]
MQYIVYDLEMTNRLSEIIEIGAVRMRVINGELVQIDTFQSFVQPKMDKLNSRITNLTGITKRDLISAPSYTEAIQSFRSWIGPDEYYLCSWGPEDKWALITDSTFHQSDIEWIVNHNDLQFHFSMLHDSEKGFRFGLSRALQTIQLTYEGSKHRALDDAINTALILKKMFKEIVCSKNPTSYLESKLFEPEKLVYKTKTEEDVSPFASLQKLFN